MIKSDRKKAIKDIFGQMLEDFEEGMKELQNETRKNNKETIKAISNLQQRMCKLNRSTKSPEAKKESKREEQKDGGAKEAKRAKKKVEAIPKSKSMSYAETVSSGCAQSENMEVIDEIEEVTKPTSASEVPSSTSSEVPAKSTRRRRKTKYLSKPRVLYVGDSIAHNVFMNHVEEKTEYRITTIKSYSSNFDNRSRWPNVI